MAALCHHSRGRYIGEHGNVENRSDKEHQQNHIRMVHVTYAAIRWSQESRRDEQLDSKTLRQTKLETCRLFDVAGRIGTWVVHRSGARSNESLNYPPVGSSRQVRPWADEAGTFDEVGPLVNRLDVTMAVPLALTMSIDKVLLFLFTFQNPKQDQTHCPRPA